MSEISQLEPRSIWQIFDLICSIPHISKHEAALAEKLTELAIDNGLNVVKDQIGNLIIKRPAADGFEHAPGIILQAHMDMVPASIGEFDFLTTAITPYIDGEWVRARGTSLGSDDGIGVAHALSIMFDKEFKCGSLTTILTVDEESGMSGASNLAAEHLNGKYLLNLDTSDDGFCIGCAGGARQEFTFEIEDQIAPADGHAVKIVLSGLPGGHSGMFIHENRGNAIKLLAEFLSEHQNFRLSYFDAGTADNAIPYQAVAVGISPYTPEKLQQLADTFTLLTQKELDAAHDMTIKVSAIAKPERVWTAGFCRNVLDALTLVPNEVFDFDDKLNVVRTSSNLAIVHTLPGKVAVRTSQRSLDDNRRDEICEAIRMHFELFNASGEIGDVYPSTPPVPDSELLRTAMIAAEKFNRKNTPYAIHGGLESGWFSKKNPGLQFISTGPAHFEHHTPEEKLLISSVAEFDRFLRELIQTLTK